MLIEWVRGLHKAMVSYKYLVIKANVIKKSRKTNFKAKLLLYRGQLFTSWKTHSTQAALPIPTSYTTPLNSHVKAASAPSKTNTNAWYKLHPSVDPEDPFDASLQPQT
jgi:hypothetical protein